MLYYHTIAYKFLNHTSVFSTLLILQDVKFKSVMILLTFNATQSLDTDLHGNLTLQKNYCMIIKHLYMNSNVINDGYLF